MVKIPRFTFEKFPQADPTLTTQMKSVGEAMAIGRTFKESMQKALRSLEIGRFGLGGDGKDIYPILADGDWDLEAIRRKLTVPNAERIFFIRHAFLAGYDVEEVHELTEDRSVVPAPAPRNRRRGEFLPRRARAASRCGGRRNSASPTANWPTLSGLHEGRIRAQRQASGLIPTYRLVDTCAAEFEAYTPYFYSTYGDEDETRESEERRS